MSADRGDTSNLGASETPRDYDERIAAAAGAKRAWVTPTCEQLPILTGLWLQGPQGSGIHGGGGPGGTVFPH